MENPPAWRQGMEDVSLEVARVKLNAAVISRTGRVRRNNEDNFILDGRCLPQNHDDGFWQAEDLAHKPILMGVFDGMGGHSDGEIASFLAARTALEWENTMSSRNDLSQRLRQLCFGANDVVCREAAGSGMGTTAALVCFQDDRAAICNVGDSPVFRLRQGQLVQLSVDHNQRASYERATGMQPKPGQKFKLTQCIGIPPEQLRIEPYCRTEQVLPGDIYLLCSDGLTDMVCVERIREILADAATPGEMVQRLSDTAMDAGGRDNITVLCAVAQEAPVRRFRWFGRT